MDRENFFDVSLLSLEFNRMTIKLRPTNLGYVTNNSRLIYLLQYITYYN